MEYSFPRYLLAKQTVDVRALNKDVFEALKANLPAAPLSIVEIGAGIGTMLTRLIQWGLLKDADYLALDEMAENIAYASEGLPRRAADGLILILGLPLQLPPRRHAGEEPRQLAVLRHVRLDEQGAALGIQPGGQQGERHLPGAGGQRLRLVRLGHGVQVHDAEEALMLSLERHPVLHRAQVVADVELAGGLDAGEDAHKRTTLYTTTRRRHRGGRARRELPPQDSSRAAERMGRERTQRFRHRDRSSSRGADRGRADPRRAGLAGDGRGAVAGAAAKRRHRLGG